MVDKIEMSLDDIIKANRNQKKPRGPRRGVAPRSAKTRRVSGRVNDGLTPRKGASGSGGVLKGRTRGGIQKPKFTRGDVNSAWKHDMYDGPRRSGAPLTVGSTKLLVGNLDYGVSNTDIKELFVEFGGLKKASVHYDRSGRSLGTADVIFERRSDALKAIQQYNGVPLDGRPMTIQLAQDVNPASRIAGGGGRVVQRGKSIGDGVTTPRRGKGPIRGGPRRRALGGSKGEPGNTRTTRTRQAPPTAEELDAELDAYANDMKQ